MFRSSSCDLRLGRYHFLLSNIHPLSKCVLGPTIKLVGGIMVPAHDEMKTNLINNTAGPHLNHSETSLNQKNPFKSYNISCRTRESLCGLDLFKTFIRSGKSVVQLLKNEVLYYSLDLFKTFIRLGKSVVQLLKNEVLYYSPRLSLFVSFVCLFVCLSVCVSVCLSHLFLSHALTQKLLLWSVTQVWPTTEAY